ncbi:MAG: polysaccharide deacetylase family protein [Defluviitaleaceae bacterium]|nr:polysaccharide deacetylase family protein [Defluviitaleaceae bacterium]
MRSKIFWLVVLAMVVLITVISFQTMRGDRYAGVDLIQPFTPVYQVPGHEAYDYDENEEPVIEEPPAPQPGKLDLTTDTFFVAGRYAGFLTWGYFKHPNAHTDIIVVESLVRDTYTDAVLEISDIIDSEQIEKALSLLAEAILAYAPEAAPYLDMIDNSWLTHLVMDHEGLGVLVAPDIAEWDLGFMYILLSYEDLDEAFLLGIELGLREPPVLPMVALTFDDGPSPYTDMILDILEEHGARATFCVLGYRINRHPEILRRAVDMGSEVIGHSWDHTDFTRLNAAAVQSQITRTSAEIEAVIGQSPPPIMRAPFGQLNNRAINAARELGYSLLHWSVDPRDWYNRDADVIYYNIMRHVMEGSIILLHDIRPTTVEAMLQVIPRLIEDGFQLVTASELIAFHFGELEPGEKYIGFRNAAW